MNTSREQNTPNGQESVESRDINDELNADVDPSANDSFSSSSTLEDTMFDSETRILQEYCGEPRSARVAEEYWDDPGNCTEYSPGLPDDQISETDSTGNSRKSSELKQDGTITEDHASVFSIESELYCDTETGGNAGNTSGLDEDGTVTEEPEPARRICARKVCTQYCTGSSKWCVKDTCAADLCISKVQGARHCVKHMKLFGLKCEVKGCCNVKAPGSERCKSKKKHDEEENEEILKLLSPFPFDEYLVKDLDQNNPLSDGGDSGLSDLNLDLKTVDPSPIGPNEMDSNCSSAVSESYSSGTQSDTNYDSNNGLSHSESEVLGDEIFRSTGEETIVSDDDSVLLENNNQQTANPLLKSVWILVIAVFISLLSYSQN